MAQHTSSLSKGAEAGIGAGATLAAVVIIAVVIIAVVIIALLVWVVLLRKRLRYHGRARYMAGGHDSSMISKGLPEDAG